MAEPLALTAVIRRPSRAREERGRANVFILLRFTLLIATSYMLLAEEGFGGLSPLLTVWIGVGLLSNLAVTRLPRRLLESPAFTAGSLVADTLWITLGLLVTGRFEAEFFYLYFFVLFLAAVGESLALIALGTVLVSAGYLYTLSASGVGSILETSTLIRLPFLFTVASFYGYLVDRVRRERQRATTEAETVTRLEEVRRNLETANRRLEREARERRRAEDQVRKLSRAVEQSPAIVVITDLHGRIEYVNPRFSAVTGYRADRVLGEDVRAVGAPDDGPGEHTEIADVLAAGAGWRGEIRYQRSDGDVFWAATSVSPLRNPEGEQTHFIVVQEDATERKRAEESLKQANRELAKVSELKSAFVSTVSHELRTPLTSIKNAIDLLRGGKAGALTDDQRRFLDMAKRNQVRLGTIIDDLLDLSRIEAGRLDYQFEEVPPRDLLVDVLETLQPQAIAAGIDLALAAPDDLSRVVADSKRLVQVLTNLVGNALKFTPGGGRVTLECRAAGPWIELSVADTGPGIPAPDRDRIFEPFFQSHDAERDHLTRTARGTGLGLSISRELARAHGGDLRVECPAEGGSRFTLRLPSDPARAREAVALEEEIREYRKYPFFGVLVIGWDDAALATPPLGDREGRLSVLLALRDQLRQALPRDCDVIRVEPAHGRLILVLLATPREGSEVVRRRLEKRLPEMSVLVDGVAPPPPQILGPALFPDDGDCGRVLVDLCLSACLPKGDAHDHAEDPAGRRRARRGGSLAFPAPPGRVRGDDCARRRGGSGDGAGDAAGPGAPRRDDAAGERVSGRAHAAGG